MSGTSPSALDTLLGSKLTIQSNGVTVNDGSGNDATDVGEINFTGIGTVTYAPAGTTADKSTVTVPLTSGTP